MPAGAGLRVALDVTPLIAGSTGVARYARELGAALAGQGVDLAPFAVGRALRPVPAGARHLRVPLRVVQRSWRLTGRPRAEDLVGPVQVVHSLDLAICPSTRPTVATVHDLAAVDHPGLHPRRAVAQQRARLVALAQARVVLADSAATARALVSHGAAGAGRVQVVPLGLSALPSPVDPPVDGPFLLAVGELCPRKGYECLVQALAQAGLGPLKLVLAGPDGGCGPGLDALAAREGLGSRLVVLGRVDDAVLAGLYRDALALCLPSWAEGFALPVLEAMAAGLPVVASDLEVVAELAGDAAVLVAPGDVAAWAGALSDLVADAGLRHRLASAGPPRAAGFTWEAAAQATIAAYRQALAWD